jgi:hypothetical protein
MCSGAAVGGGISLEQDIQAAHWPGNRAMASATCFSPEISARRLFLMPLPVSSFF